MRCQCCNVVCRANLLYVLLRQSPALLCHIRSGATSTAAVNNLRVQALACPLSRECGVDVTVMQNQFVDGMPFPVRRYGLCNVSNGELIAAPAVSRPG